MDESTESLEKLACFLVALCLVEIIVSQEENDTSDWDSRMQPNRGQHGFFSKWRVRNRNALHRHLMRYQFTGGIALDGWKKRDSVHFPILCLDPLR